jgi:hypothetical protein
MMRKGRIGYRGASIVEILIAMVVLVIGIFGIIRIFPTGFGIILYGERVTLARKLAEGALEQARVNADSLPDAIVPITRSAQNPTLVVLDPTVTPAVENYDLTQPFPTDLLDQSFYGFNRTRRVIGETTKIPPPSADVPYLPMDPETGDRQLVSLYTAQYGPIDTRFGNAQPIVYGGRGLERVVFTEEPDQAVASNLGVFRYGVMYGADRLILYFAPAAEPRIYKVQYSYLVSDPANSGAVFRADSVPNLQVMVPANQFRIELPMPSDGAPEPGDEQVARIFTQIARDTAFSESDPFQFKLLDPVIGIFGFNPLAAVVRQSGGSRGLTAKIDYDVYDWHIVREDIKVPEEAPHRVKLTLGYLKRSGDVQDDQTVYPGLMQGLTNIDVMVVDLDRGVRMFSPDLHPEVPSDQDNGDVDYRAGMIDFDPAVRWDFPGAGQESIGGKNIRIYYRTEDNFGLQVQKAFTNYLRAQIPTMVLPGQYGQLPHGYLVFPASDHDQTVLIDYTFTEQGTGRRVRVSGELQPIRDPVSPESLDTPTSIFPGLSPALWFVRVNNASRYGANDPGGRPNVEPGSIVIHSVRGVSLRSRVAWREGNRWRRLESSTYLSRKGA